MTAFRVARLYDYQPPEGQTAIFPDRLYPPAVHNEPMSPIVRPQALTPPA